MRTTRLMFHGALLVSALVSSGCGDEDSDTGNSSSTLNNASNVTTPNGSANSANGTANNIVNGSTPNAPSPNSTTANNGTTNNTTANNTTPSNNSTPNNPMVPCDYEAVDGIVTIEAENLPLNEEWQIGTEVAGYQGSGYAFWSGQSHNNDPTHGVIQIAVSITEPGRYQLEWRARIGMGTNTTEHNDAWIRFPDAADYYGLKGSEGAEIRRYYKPICEDAGAMAAIEALPDVETADCARGSTKDGWMKVYGAGTDWRWAGRTSDSDPAVVTAEFPAAGVYTIEFAARADLLLLDTVVFRLESVASGDARGLAETACTP